MTRYAIIVLVATALLVACGPPAAVAIPCKDAAEIDSCTNWDPASKPLCYVGAPGPSPEPNMMCGGFGTTDGMGQWAAWCCAPAPVMIGGCLSASDCAPAPCGVAMCDMDHVCSYSIPPGCQTCQTSSDCTADVCHVATCIDGTCSQPGAPDGTPCGAGKFCQVGACVASAAP